MFKKRRPSGSRPRRVSNNKAQGRDRRERPWVCREEMIQRRRRCTGGANGRLACGPSSRVASRSLANPGSLPSVATLGFVVPPLRGEDGGGHLHKSLRKEYRALVKRV